MENAAIPFESKVLELHWSQKSEGEDLLLICTLLCFLSRSIISVWSQKSNKFLPIKYTALKLQQYVFFFS